MPASLRRPNYGISLSPMPRSVIWPKCGALSASRLRHWVGAPDNPVLAFLQKAALPDAGPNGGG